LKVKKTQAMPKAIPKSPTLLTSIAFTADLPACILFDQNPIKRKEVKPTPSQPKNITTKLSEVTRKTIKAVNNDKYAIKRF
jgi:hypothetical protein